MPEFDHIDRQSHQTKDLLQWHRRKILTEQKMAMLPYHTPIRAKKINLRNKKAAILIK